LRHFGAVRDVLILQLGADKEQQVPELRAINNVNGLRKINTRQGIDRDSPSQTCLIINRDPLYQPVIKPWN
jgi:hypothetical protein